MARIHISIDDGDLSFIDMKCMQMNITRSEYIKYILFYIKKDIPAKEKNMNLIKAINNLDIEIKRLLLKDHLSTYEKIKINEEIKSIKQSMERFT